MSNYGTKNQIIPLSDVEIGINYAIIITTNAGLWRYKIGDTIKFTSLNPYKIKVTGKESITLMLLEKNWLLKILILHFECIPRQK